MGKLSVLILSASPSLDSLSLSCALEFSKKISSKKAGVMSVCKYKISSCRGCRSCDTRRCALRDDFLKLNRRVKKADIVITASPVYFMGVPSYFKAFIDRHQQFWNREGKAKKMQGFIILTAGSDSAKVFAGAEREIRAMYAVNGIQTAGVLHLRATDLPGSGEKALKRSGRAAEKFLKGRS